MKKKKKFDQPYFQHFFTNQTSPGATTTSTPSNSEFSFFRKKEKEDDNILMSKGGLKFPFVFDVYNDKIDFEMGPGRGDDCYNYFYNYYKDIFKNNLSENGKKYLDRCLADKKFKEFIRFYLQEIFTNYYNKKLDLKEEDVSQFIFVASALVFEKYIDYLQALFESEKNEFIFNKLNRNVLKKFAIFPDLKMRTIIQLVGISIALGSLLSFEKLSFNELLSNNFYRKIIINTMGILISLIPFFYASRKKINLIKDAINTDEFTYLYILTIIE